MFLNKLTSIKTSWFLLFIIIIYTIILFFNNAVIFTDDFYFRSFSENISVKNFEILNSARLKYGWIEYLLNPVWILSKVIFATVCISIGVILSAKQINFRDIFKVSVASEFVFIISKIIYSINLYLNKETLTQEIIARFQPLSVLYIFNYENINSQWVIYPLQTANLFEVIYVVTIAWLLSKKWKHDFFETINIIIPSYGLGLLLWVTLVAFLTFQIS